jgi:hypothetical protein
MNICGCSFVQCLIIYNLKFDVMRKLVSQERVNADKRLVDLQNSGWTIYDVEGVIMPEYTGVAKRPFSQEAIEAIKLALVTKGRNKGMLLAKCPRVDTPAAAAWMAIVSEANPFKLGIGHMLFMGEKNRALYEHILQAIKDMGLDVRGLDRDRKALETLGVW